MSTTDTQTLVRMQEETLFFLNQVKNSQSVHVGENQVLTRLFTGQKIFVEARDISVSPALIMDGHWEQEVTAMMTSLLRPTDCFIDAGANMGYFGIVAGTIIDGSKGGSIHMIEANPRLVPLIFKSINVTGLLGTAVVSNFAVSDGLGEVQLQVVKDLMGSSSLIDLDSQFQETNESSAMGFEVEEKVTVPSITLDAYVERESLDRVDLIKMDIEGYEDQAYQGMSGVIEDNRDHIRLLLEFSATKYEDPAGFYDRIKADFNYIFAIDHQTGAPVQVLSYADLEAMCGPGFAMLLVTNQEESNV